MSDGAEQDRPIPQGASALWRSVARGARDTLVGEVSAQGLRVGGTIVLAHKLAPANFGLLRELVVVAMFTTMFSESGIPDAVIQRRDLTPEHESTAWWLSLGTVSLAVGSLYCAAPLIARLMALPVLAPATRLLCLPLFLEGTAIIPVARLARNLHFRALAAADVLAELAFLTAAFALLWRGQGEWSLPAGVAARLATHATVVWIADHRIPLGRPRWRAARDIGRFALTVLSGRIVTVASANADFILVGRLLGATMLGYYSIARDLLRFVPDRIHRIVGRVALPAFCRMREDDRELGEAYCNFLQYLARIVLPVAAVVAIAAPRVLTTLYGNKWLPAAVPMRLLACGLALMALRMATTSVYYAKNYPSMDLLLNGTRLILVVAGIAATARFGLVGVSASVGAVEGIISLAGQYAVCLITGLHFSKALSAIVPSLNVTAACGLAALLGDAIAVIAGLHGLPAMACLALATGIAFLWLEGAQLKEMFANTFAPVGVHSLETPID